MLLITRRVMVLSQSAAGFSATVQAGEKMQSGGGDQSCSGETQTAFRTAFKYYKARATPPDLSGVINVESWKLAKPVTLEEDEPIDQTAAINLGLNPVSDWRVYDFERYDGLRLIRNCISRAGQYLWAERCLRRYCADPYETNSDAFLETRRRAREDEYFNDDEILMKRLRWATVGYHHNWDTKEYDDNHRSTVPDELQELGAFMAQAVHGYMNFKTEAAIINYYHSGSTLSAHRDYSERNQNAPLISFSIGQPAVFLMGGATLNEEPTALWLRTGDCMVCTGDARLAYHAVPRLCEGMLRFEGREGESERVIVFLNANRLNMNIRQVNY